MPDTPLNVFATCPGRVHRPRSAASEAVARLTVAATLSPEDVVIHTGISYRCTGLSILGDPPHPVIFPGAKTRKRASSLACIRPPIVEPGTRSYDHPGR